MPDLASSRVRASALVVLGVLAAALAYVFVGSDDSTPAPTPPPPAASKPLRPTVSAITARVVSGPELKAAAASSSHPVYWAGPRPGVRYELTRATDGRTYVRYLTPGAVVGDTASRYLVIATYPQAGAFNAVSAEAAKPGNTRIDLPAGGLAVAAPGRPQAVYLSYPGADYQVEVFSPKPGEARRLVSNGSVRPLGGGTPVATGAAVGLTLPELRAAGRRSAFYWAGPRPGVRYELTQTPSGHTFVRYLEGEAALGDPRAQYVTVATYPAKNAFSQVKSVTTKKGTVTVKLSGGGLAVFAKAKPTSVFVGYPSLPYQVEVFSPKPGEARSLVLGGKITRAG